ncbi:hypothetical protein [Cryobacterium sp. Sr3]|uniref:hypothetical protein n=1 Tax=Cryobacterium sp. Sr3 TaxID=1259194 RepID=UPI00106C5F9C|nr:hypothetical protein [Cryobacterium sp. Sr3]TFB53416.1 hypothetical protein E3N94_14975 [Cryobacterium sp. Sr3]
MNETMKLILYKGKYWVPVLPLALVAGLLLGSGNLFLGAVVLAATVVAAIWLFNKIDRPSTKRSRD